MKMLSAMIVLALSTAALPALAAEETLTVINRTGYTIAEIYVAPTRSNNWEEDVMGKDVLITGESVDIDFSISEDVCVWDLRVVYDDETDAVWDRVNLCKISEISLFYNRKTDVTSATFK